MAIRSPLTRITICLISVLAFVRAANAVPALECLGPECESVAVDAAVVRVVNVVGRCRSYGSGTLIDCGASSSTVLSCAHLFRDGVGSIEVAFRDGRQALAHARRAVELIGEDDAAILDTLSAAYAESGNFAEAVRWQEKAVQLAGNERKDLAARLVLRQALLDHHRDNLFRDAATRRG